MDFGPLGDILYLKFYRRGLWPGRGARPKHRNHSSWSCFADFSQSNSHLSGGWLVAWACNYGPDSESLAGPGPRLEARVPSQKLRLDLNLESLPVTWVMRPAWWPRRLGPSKTLRQWQATGNEPSQLPPHWAAVTDGHQSWHHDCIECSPATCL